MEVFNSYQFQEVIQMLTSSESKYHSKCFSMMDDKCRKTLYIGQGLFRGFVHSNWSVLIIFLVVGTPDVLIILQPTHFVDTRTMNMILTNKFALNGTLYSSLKESKNKGILYISKQ